MVLNFAKLKKRVVKANIGAGGKVDATSNKASTLPSKVDKASSMPPQKAKAQPVVDALSSDDSLLLSKFCYGCPQFSVDYPFTNKEAAWCIREGERGREGESGYHMVRIYKKHKISQCPRIKAGLRGLELLIEF